MKKKIIISAIFIVICIISIAIPLSVNASKDEKWQTVELSKSAINILNESTQYNLMSTNSELPLATNKNPFEQDMKERTENIINDNEPYIFTEPTEEERELYNKWDEERKEYERKNKIVKDLLNKYYPKESNTIDEMGKKERDGKIALTLEVQESQIKRTELIVRLCKENKLNKEETEACKKSLKNYYDHLRGDARFSEDLKEDIEKIIK